MKSAITDTVAVFESTAFNHTEPLDTFINPCCYGDDLARWLMARLAQHGASVDEQPGQEDFGWYFGFVIGGEKYCLVISSDGEGGWFLVVERACGFLASLLGGRHRNVGRAGVAAIAAALAGAEEIENLRWVSWKAFRDGGSLAA